MKPAERYQVIINYLENDDVDGSVDVLNDDFVTHYMEKTGAKAGICFYGAPKCRQLGQDLSKMHKLKLLKREICPVDLGMGFPKWVYSYCLK